MLNNILKYITCGIATQQIYSTEVQAFNAHAY